ncbi:hypothetical protein Fmac_005623 [Flemingia macrophylla]|uniref:Uncharacterized protein n=1 Tax=Flemingia macrophylla TaxID=520843 RepID=A0ABD1N899_9FABA
MKPTFAMIHPAGVETKRRCFGHDASGRHRMKPTFAMIHPAGVETKRRCFGHDASGRHRMKPTFAMIHPVEKKLGGICTGNGQRPARVDQGTGRPGQDGADRSDQGRFDFSSPHHKRHVSTVTWPTWPPPTISPYDSAHLGLRHRIIDDLAHLASANNLPLSNCTRWESNQ